MNDEKPKIACLANGPYYLLNDMNPQVVPNICKSNGDPCLTVTGVALCRCGGSQNKPFCDGTHGKNGFKDEKLADGTADKRDQYVGKKITIHDNRGVCAHIGHCTDGLKSVFKLKQEPWIDPNGATVEEIIQTINKCPSGALSYSIEDVEHKDHERETMVTVLKNGPYAIAGGIELLDQEMVEGTSREHYTLCRCGGSKNKPFCDGTHWEIGFTDEKN
jgi:CDGSH-type Zn-finger protein